MNDSLTIANVLTALPEGTTISPGLASDRLDKAKMYVVQSGTETQYRAGVELKKLWEAAQLPFPEACCVQGCTNHSAFNIMLDPSDAYDGWYRVCPAHLGSFIQDNIIPNIPLSVQRI